MPDSTPIRLSEIAQLGLHISEIAQLGLHISEIAQLGQPCTPGRLTQTLLREGDKDNIHGGGVTPAVEREGYVLPHKFVI